MLLKNIFDSQFGALEKSMNLSWRRHKAISSNIANAETPQYRAVDLHFGSELDRAFSQYDQQLKTTQPGHMDLEEAGGARLIADLSGATKPDGNNVDIDLQMGRLAQNSGKYSRAANLLRRRFQRISSALRVA